MKNILIHLLTILGLTILFSCSKSKDEEIQFTLFKATGNITTRLDEFRNTLGNLNTAPNTVGGRREINWDGIADSLLNKPLPQNFFNTVGDAIPASRQRGLIYDDGEFQVSATNFSHINPLAASEFTSFSGNKVFSNTTNLDWPVDFQVAGTTKPAAVSAFGMVFSDVDKENTVSLEFFEHNKILGKFFVPPHDATSKFSFLGVNFHTKLITRIRMKHEGKLADGEKDISQGGTKDLFVIDDLIYSEPVQQ